MKKTLGCFIRILVVIGILLFIFFLFLQLSGGSCIRKIDRTLPAEETATWEVTTPMKLYYAEKVEVVKDGESIVSVTMTGWYERVNDKWVRREKPITLERRIYGKIEVKGRQQLPPS